MRRSWLLAALSAPLDYLAHDRTRLLQAMALDDGELIRALGGRRKAALSSRYAALRHDELRPPAGVQTVCEHDRCYPEALTAAPRVAALHVAGGIERLSALAAAPVVALVGSARASDYGLEIARSIARGSAAAGVTVASGLSDGIAGAAQAGALEGRGGTLAVLAGGLDVGCPASCRTLLERALERGCALAELPGGAPPRRWGRPASERVVAALARVTIVVEAEDSPRELACASAARAMGRLVAAVPGRVTSRLSTGPHALLLAGARLVRDAADVLELLYGSDAQPVASGTIADPGRLEPRLSSVLERVGAGEDTPEKLAGGATGASELLLALSELELLGLLARGDGGRYLPREALRQSPPCSG